MMLLLRLHIIAAQLALITGSSASGPKTILTILIDDLVRPSPIMPASVWAYVFHATDY
jgi:arylsulfatase A-like enzyme